LAARPLVIATCAQRAGANALVAIQLDCLPAFGGAGGDQGFVAALPRNDKVGHNIFRTLERGECCSGGHRKLRDELRFVILSAAKNPMGPPLLATASQRLLDSSLRSE
jgi:hypothetical protein